MNDVSAAAAAAVLSLSFGWAAVAKALRPDRLRSDLSRYRLPRALRAIGLLALPWVELSVVALLLFWTLVAGATIAVVLLGIFSVAIVRLRMLQQANRVPCGCFGGSAARDYRLLLARNGLLASLAILVLASGRETPLLVASASAVPTVTLFGPLLMIAVAWIGWQAVAYVDRQRGR